MRLESVRIQNLRSFEDETITIEDYTCLVGPNGAGKSTVLCALNIFFRENDHSPKGQDLTELTEEDFHRKNTEQPIRITVTFGDLSPEAQTEFAHYFRQGRLVVTAEAWFDKDSRKATVKQFGQRLGMDAFRIFFAKSEDASVKVPELKADYAELKKTYPDLPAAATKGAMVDALREYEQKRPEKCALIQASDQFYGWSGANLLAKYVQWVFVPAVKDAAGEQIEVKDSALSKLIARAVGAKANLKQPIEDLRTKTQQDYLALLARHEGALKTLSDALQTKLAQWSHPSATVRLEWNKDESAVKVGQPLAGVRAGEAGFEGALCRLGHGLQRSYIMALLHELSGSGLEHGPRLLLACEEPELYQHPPQTRYLGDVFRKLSTKNAQVFICTHSPHFVVGDHFESIRLVRKAAGASKATVASATWQVVAEKLAAAAGDEPLRREEGALAEIHQALTTSINDMFFTPVLFLVEGAEDVAYATTYLNLLGLWDEWRRLGCHLVSTDRKSNMLRPLAVAQALRIPTFIFFDADGHQRNANHERNNKALLKLCGASEPEAYPAETLWKSDVVVWHSELGDIVRGELASETWDRVKARVEARYGQPGDLAKKALFIADTLGAAWAGNIRSATLERLCRHMLAFAKQASASPTQAPSESSSTPKGEAGMSEDGAPPRC